MINHNAMTDRERILINIAAQLACELASLQSLPAVQEYMTRSSVGHVVAEYGGVNNPRYEKGDLVVCHTSAGIQQNPWIVSFVEKPGTKYDDQGLLLRAIGSDKTCNYSNESFIRIRGIAERLLWESTQHELAVKINKAIRQLDNYWHCFRGLEFDKERADLARLYIGERWGGPREKPTKPYIIEIIFSKRTTIKGIIEQMEAQGFGKREFEPDDGTYQGPMQGRTVITRADIVNELSAAGLPAPGEKQG